jgi:hypothetical protein
MEPRLLADVVAPQKRFGLPIIIGDDPDHRREPWAAALV